MTETKGSLSNIAVAAIALLCLALVPVVGLAGQQRGGGGQSATEEQQKREGSQGGSAQAPAPQSGPGWWDAAEATRPAAGRARSGPGWWNAAEARRPAAGGSAAAPERVPAGGRTTEDARWPASGAGAESWRTSAANPGATERWAGERSLCALPGRTGTPAGAGAATDLTRGAPEQGMAGASPRDQYSASGAGEPRGADAPSAARPVPRTSSWAHGHRDLSSGATERRAAPHELAQAGELPARRAPRATRP